MFKKINNELFGSKEEEEDFMVWAYGEHWEELETAMDYLKAWNTLHYDLLYLKPTGSINDDVQRMIAFWEDRKNK